MLTAQQVREWQLGDSLEQVAQAWATMPERERVEWTGRFFRVGREGVLDVGRLGFLTVKRRDGRWRLPPEVFFGEAHASEHRLELLAARGLLRVEPEEMPLLSEAYLAAGGGGEVSEWRRFFQALGVHRRLENERLREVFAERVAEEVLVPYERSRGRQPARVPLSQERGYDFESGGRRIELEGRSRPEPAIDLTRPQYQALSDEAYYVYVVADALRHPVLHMVRGPKLLGLLPEPTFRYGDWGAGGRSLRLLEEKGGRPVPYLVFNLASALVGAAQDLRFPGCFVVSRLSSTSSRSPAICAASGRT